MAETDLQLRVDQTPPKELFIEVCISVQCVIDAFVVAGARGERRWRGDRGGQQRAVGQKHGAFAAKDGLRAHDQVGHAGANEHALVNSELVIWTMRFFGECARLCFPFLNLCAVFG